jgi:hypothetical protein
MTISTAPMKPKPATPCTQYVTAVLRFGNGIDFQNHPELFLPVSVDYIRREVIGKREVPTRELLEALLGLDLLEELQLLHEAALIPSVKAYR